MNDLNETLKKLSLDALWFIVKFIICTYILLFMSTAIDTDLFRTLVIILAIVGLAK